MKTLFKLKVISFFLTAIILLFSFLSCTTNDNNQEDNSDISVSSSIPSSSETTAYLAPLVVDYSGYIYNVLVIGNNLWVPLYYSEAGQETAELMNDALYKREQIIEDIYKCELNIIVDSNAHVTFENAYLADDEICDISMFSGSNSMSLATKGYLYDINNIEDFNLDAPWWDQRIQKEYLIGDKLFTIDGDISVRDDLRTMAIVYNKAVYEDYGYIPNFGTPYVMVSDKSWTYEKMMRMINGISKNLDSEENMTQNDFWGMLSELTAPYYFFLGSGRKTIQNNNGALELVIKDSSAYESFYDTISETMKMAINPDVLVVNNGKIITSDQWTVAVEMFKSDKCLFRSTTLSAVNGLLSMTSDYGILPIPAYEENQDGYYCWVSGTNHTPITIPNNTPDIERTAIITEAIAYHSMFSGLTEAFYEKLAEARLCRSEEDVKMLNIIFASKTYDIDQACNITGIESSMYSIAKSQDLSTLTSMLKTQKSLAERKLADFIEKILLNNP